MGTKFLGKCTVTQDFHSKGVTRVIKAEPRWFFVFSYKRTTIKVLQSPQTHTSRRWQSGYYLASEDESKASLRFIAPESELSWAEPRRDLPMVQVCRSKAFINFDKFVVFEVSFWMRFSVLLGLYVWFTSFKM